MTRKTRLILFLSLAILFLISAPLTVFYSLGWRLNWKTKKIIQPGVFYFKVWPKNAEIHLDNQLKEKTDFFFGSAFIENLLPKKYEVEIKKKGYHKWKKTLEIKQREVTEAKNIVLIPQKPDFKILSKQVEKIFFSPDNKKIISLESETTSEKEEIVNKPVISNQKNNNYQAWTLKLYDLDKNVKSHLIDEKDISLAFSHLTKHLKTKIEFFNLKFSPDSKKVLLELEWGERKIYFLLEIEKTPPVITSLGFLDLAPEKIDFNPQNSQKLFIFKNNQLKELDLTTKRVSKPLLEDIIAYSIAENAVYYLDNSGFLMMADFSFDRKEKLNTNPLSLKEEADYQITVSPFDIVLKENNFLYLLNKNQKSFEKISDSAKNFKFSPDFKKIVYLNDYEIWILFLDKTYYQPQKEAGDKLFLTRFSEKIDKIFWLTNHYLIFQINNQIKIAEIDDRDEINIVNLAEDFEKPEIFWNQINKRLYILTNKTLYASEELAP